MEKRGRARSILVAFVFALLVVGVRGQSVPAPPAASANGSATITRDQADAILNELRQIRRLLEVNGRPAAVPQRPPQTPRNIRMPVTPGWHVLGRDDAPVTLVEFADYQCPYCRRFHADTFAELKKSYIDTGKLRFISRDLPLNFHANALAAAQAVRCAGEQGKYWEVRAALIAHGDDLGLESIVSYAGAAGADTAQLRTCVASDKYKAEIQKEAAEAAALSVSGTPSFLVARTGQQELQGELIRGAVPLAVFDSAIRKLLAEPTPTGTGEDAEKQRP